MFRQSLIVAAGLIGLSGASVARADHEHGGDPIVRFGIDMIWGGGGYAHVAPAPRIAWVPVPAYGYYASPRYYAPPVRHYRGRGHWKHQHHDDQDHWNGRGRGHRH